MPIQRNERALVVISQLTNGIPPEFQWLYQFIQFSGRVAVQRLLAPAYGDFRELYDIFATDLNLLNTLQACGANPDIKAIDLIIMLHGNTNTLFFYNGPVAMGNFATQIANLNLKGKLRLVYSLACYGDSHSDDFVSGGFASSIGAVAVNANASAEFPTFLTNWASGLRLNDVLNLAESPLTRIPADSLAKAFGSLAGLWWAPYVNSDKVLRGNQKITIDSALDFRYLTPGDLRAVYGATIRLNHLLTGGGLYSHPHNYGHPGSSGQQQITAYGGTDDNDYWRLKGAHGSPNGFRAGQPIGHGEVIRLEHVATTRNLHSHAGVPSPVTGQQEVTCFGQNGSGDENDNWRVEVEGGGPWTFGKRVRLIHLPTDHALHSHAGHSHQQWTMGQQEATCYSGRDDNDWWYLTEIQAPALNAAEFVSQEVTSIMSPQGRQIVSLTFRNTGTSTWEPNQGYLLGSQAPQDNQNWGRHRSQPLAAAVPPGTEATFSFPITAPPTVGGVNFQWKMVQETVEWFGQESPLIQIGIGPDVNLLQVGVIPYPVPINRDVTITVNASDPSTGSNVVGQVKIDGNVVANTNTPFSYKFKPARRRVSVRPPEWEVTYPMGIVVASGYPDAVIDFGFPDI